VGTPTIMVVVQTLNLYKGGVMNKYKIVLTVAKEYMKEKGFKSIWSVHSFGQFIMWVKSKVMEV
jgi:hypothetical protein